MARSTSRPRRTDPPEIALTTAAAVAAGIARRRLPATRPQRRRKPIGPCAGVYAVGRRRLGLPFRRRQREQPRPDLAGDPLLLPLRRLLRRDDAHRRRLRGPAAHAAGGRLVWRSPGLQWQGAKVTRHTALQRLPGQARARSQLRYRRAATRSFPRFQTPHPERPRRLGDQPVRRRPGMARQGRRQLRPRHMAEPERPPGPHLRRPRRRSRLRRLGRRRHGRMAAPQSRRPLRRHGPPALAVLLHRLVPARAVGSASPAGCCP